MKKQVVLLVAVALSTAAFSQEKISAGIRAGVTTSRMEGDAMQSLKDLIEYTDGMITTANRTGIYAGGNVNIPLSKVMSVEPGLYYTQKGMELRGALDLKGVEFLGAGAKAQLNTHYVDMPVVLKATISGFQVFAGPHVSYLAQADLKTSAGILGYNIFNRKMDATEYMNRWDAGVTGGVGYRFKNISLTAAYDHGLMKTDADQNMDAYNRSLKVGIGVNF
ncbi:MAG TPA: porin family protein [Flavisolibacter sp.]